MRTRDQRRRRGPRPRGDAGFTLIEIMVTMTIIAALTAGVALGVRAASERSRRLQCSQNLAGFGSVFQTLKLERPGAQRYSGSALFLAWRKKRDPIRFREEERLLCPGDPGALFPANDEERARWDDVDLTHIPDGLCSYAVRDFQRFKLRADSGELTILACDRQGDSGDESHHSDGLNVLFDDGTVRFMSREQLGIDPEEPVAVGRQSDHVLLSKVVVRPDE